MSGAQQFTAAVPERSGPTDWRGGLERMRRKAGQGRAFLVERGGMRLDSDTAPALCAREKNKAESRWSLSTVALLG